MTAACATQITFNGSELPRTTQPFYFAVNKPKGYLCANVPNKQGTTKLVVDLFEVRLKLELPPSCPAMTAITLFVGLFKGGHASRPWQCQPKCCPEATSCAGVEG